MQNRTKSLIYSAIIGLIIVIIFLGFLSSLTNPISWALIAVLILIPLLHKKTTGIAQVEWKDEYSVGIESIDNDHKQLIYLLNQFTIAYDYAMNESFEAKAFYDLLEYTRYHFKREEELMQENSYPDFEAHKLQHEKMINQTEEFVRIYQEKGHDSLKEVSDFLTHWLINHINGTDKEYSEHLNSCGVQ